jgi:hypothetical protein
MRHYNQFIANFLEVYEAQRPSLSKELQEKLKHFAATSGLELNWKED